MAVIDLAFLRIELFLQWFTIKSVTRTQVAANPILRRYFPLRNWDSSISFLLLSDVIIWWLSLAAGRTIAEFRTSGNYTEDEFWDFAKLLSHQRSSSHTAMKLHTFKSVSFISNIQIKISYRTLDANLNSTAYLFSIACSFFLEYEILENVRVLLDKWWCWILFSKAIYTFYFYNLIDIWLKASW